MCSFGRKDEKEKVTILNYTLTSNMFAILEILLPAEERCCNVLITSPGKKNGCLATGLQMAPEKQKQD